MTADLAAPFRLQLPALDRKGSATRLLSWAEAALRRIDPDFEEPSLDFPAPSPARPIGFRFHFVEVAGGAGGVSKAHAAYACTNGPNINLSLSPAYDLASPDLVLWI